MNKVYAALAVMVAIAVGLCIAPWITSNYHPKGERKPLVFAASDDDPFKGCFSNPAKSVNIRNGFTLFDKDGNNVPDCVRDGEREFALVQTQLDADSQNSIELDRRRLNRPLRRCPDGTEEMGTIDKDDEDEIVLKVCGKPEYGSYRSLEKYNYQAVFNKHR